MNILITGAAGNLGSHLARFLMGRTHELRLLIHRKNLPFDVSAFPNVSVYRADLEDPRTLSESCRGVDCVVHFAGLLFAPRPEKFLPRTNVEYVRNIVAASLGAHVRKFILISFPHVEGDSSPEKPARGLLDGNPTSVHATTRLAAEKHLYEACKGKEMVPVSLRAGMIYGRGVLMIEAARWLLKHRLLAVWREPTWNHLLALPDFLTCVKAAIENENISGIYNLADDQPLTLQEFLDAVAVHWGFRKPWRCPKWSFYATAWCCEVFATIFRTVSPLTRDFITIGMASSVADTTRMKKELLSKLAYPSLKEGLVLL
ncbi:MAG: NAD(P)-dependent oxidoreductase [Ignavibacteriae bacterium]|nr:NAD(P)-dependent oxidoreductase [Ignavibacteriota bacterium]